MGKIVKRFTAVTLALALLVTGSWFALGAGNGEAGQAQPAQALAQASGAAPLKVEITSNKNKITLLGKAEFTATVTNISSATVNNIEAKALFGASLRPLKNGSQMSATKASLAPGQNFQFKYSADINGLKGLDNLLLPLFWITSWLHGGKADAINSNSGSDYIVASKSIGLISLFSKQYDASTTVRVWYVDTIPYIPPALDDDIGVWHEVNDPIQILLHSYEMPGNETEDLEIAQDITEKIISFLETEMSKGYVTRYSVNESGIWYLLSTGIPVGVTFNEILSPIPVPDFERTSQSQFSKATSRFETAQSTVNKYKIATLQPFYTTGEAHFKTNVYDDTIKYIINMHNHSNDYEFFANLDDANVTVEAMTQLNKYRIVVINSHGNIVTTQNNSQMYGILIGYYATDREDPQVQEWIENQWITLSSSGQISLTRQFFEDMYADNSFDNTLVYLGTCMGANDPELWDVLERKGVKSLLAYSSAVNTLYAPQMYQSIFSSLALRKINGTYTNVEEALSKAKIIYGSTDISMLYIRLIKWVKDSIDKWAGDDVTEYPPAELHLLGDGDWNLYKEWPTGDGIVGGTVRNAINQEPISGATIKYRHGHDMKIGVYVQNQAGEDISLTTDDNGDYSISTLPEGNYTLEATKAGYKTAFINVVCSSDGMNQDVSMQPGGDDGTTNWDFIDPVTHTKTVPAGYIGIYTPQDLDNVRNNLAGRYIMMKDIDIASWGNWEPIGNATASFTGVFDGNGYCIKSMDIDAHDMGLGSAYLYNGFFGATSNAVICNIGLENQTINLSKDYSSYVGGIVGNADLTEIYNCFNSIGSIRLSISLGTGCVGGIAGRMKNSIIQACFNDSLIYSSGGGANGGIVGYGYGSNSELDRCYNLGNVTGLGSLSDLSNGGISGTYWDGNMTNCFNTGTIRSNSAPASGSIARAGGLVGTLAYASCKSSYNVGTLTITGSGSSYIGGLVGEVSANSLHNCYYLNNISRFAGTGSSTQNNVKSRTESEMSDEASFVGFDFGSVWAINPAINNGYPYF